MEADCGSRRLTSGAGRSLELDETVYFSNQRHFPLVIPSGARIFRERSRGYAERFLFPAERQAHRFAAIPPRVRYGLRLAHLVGMTNKDEARKSTVLDDRVKRGGPRRSRGSVDVRSPRRQARNGRASCRGSSAKPRADRQHGADSRRSLRANVLRSF